MSLRLRLPILFISILAFILTSWSLYNTFSDSQSGSTGHARIRPREPATSYFGDQFSNPAGILAVLLLVGGDTVQKAIAQTTGGRHAVFTPVVFSFGWVSYAVTMVAIAFGDGIFLPKPENAGYVVNVGTVDDDGNESLASGDRRENRSWRLWRLMRDLELSVKDEQKGVPPDLKSGLFVTVYTLDSANKHARLHPQRDWLWWIFSWAIPCQLGIAIVPWVLEQDWSIFLITLAGNFLAIFTASLPSMRKIPYSEGSRQSYALTRGNGHKHVFIIRPNSYTKGASKLPYLDRLAVNIEPAGGVTRFLTLMAAVFWIMLLVAVGGLKTGTWYLFGAGTLGMLLNIVISSMPRKSAAYGLPLKDKPERFGIRTDDNQKKWSVKMVLLALEKKYPGAGHALKPLFFTTLPNDKDRAWNEEEYSWDTAGRRLGEEIASRAVPSPSSERQRANADANVNANANGASG